MYARVVEDGDDVVAQYWFFYVFNGPGNQGLGNWHEGDWEMIQLLFRDASPTDVLEERDRPHVVVFAQHGSGQQIDNWLSLRRDETHPFVFVAAGSHASYPQPGSYQRVLILSDDASGEGPRLASEKYLDGLEAAGLQFPAEANGVAPTPYQLQLFDPATRWLAFEGHWGEQAESPLLGVADSDYSRPTGPAFKGEKWERPVRWACDLPEEPSQFQ